MDCRIYEAHLWLAIILLRALLFPPIPILFSSFMLIVYTLHVTTDDKTKPKAYSFRTPELMHTNTHKHTHTHTYG